MCVEDGVADLAALEVGPDVEGAGFLVRREGPDSVAQLWGQMGEEGEHGDRRSSDCVQKYWSNSTWNNRGPLRIIWLVSGVC